MDVEAGRNEAFKPTIAFLAESPGKPGRVDLNRASIGDLRRLPGVGPATARRIVAARDDAAILHSTDLVARRVLTDRQLAGLARAARGATSTHPDITGVSTQPDPVPYRTPFTLATAFNDSRSGVVLLRLQVESMSHSVDLVHEVDDDERAAGQVVMELPGMEAGPAEVEVSVFDRDGNTDYHATTVQVFHNPPFVWFWPSERTARLSRGAALRRSDGSFHCNSNFAFYNGTGAASTLSRNMNWRVFDQGGTVIHSGTFAFGSNISLAAGAYSSGWWFNFSFPPGSTAHNRLTAKQQIRIEWRFTELGTGALVTDDLTWRALVAVNVNIIRVADENFSATERTQIFNALRQTASSIYQAQDLDIGTIQTYAISTAQAGSKATINSNGEAEDLTGDWTVPNQAVDMFVVDLYTGSVAGLSPRPGPCDKDAKGMNGTVVEWLENQATTGVIMAHELGHYLGLPHTSSTNNLMNPTVGSGNTVLTTSQGNTMKSFPCFLRFVG